MGEFFLWLFFKARARLLYSALSDVHNGVYVRFAAFFSAPQLRTETRGPTFFNFSTRFFAGVGP